MIQRFLTFFSRRHDQLMPPKPQNPKLTVSTRPALYQMEGLKIGSNTTD
jgi:hypothetical protein